MIVSMWRIFVSMWMFTSANVKNASVIQNAGMELSFIFSSIIAVFTLSDVVRSLVCWQCIGDRCDLDPDDGSTNADKKECLKGQACQKVYFEMYSTINKRPYLSTVRSCSWNCVDKDDFKNCSSELHSSRGCTTRLCCKNADLCNASILESNSNLLMLFGFVAQFLINKC